MQMKPIRRMLTVAFLVLQFAVPVVARVPDGNAVLRVLAWPGYAEPEVVRSFEQKTGARVELTVIDSDEAMWEKISARDGSRVDVFAVNTAELQRYIASNRVQPIDVARVPNTQHQLPRFREHAAIAGLVRKSPRGDQLFGIPFTYSAMGLIYDKRQIPAPPDSFAALWDKRYRGKVLIYSGGTHKFSLAALAQGNASPFRLDAGQFPRAVDQLIALRRNVLAIYTQPDESVRLFKRHEAALMFANYGMQQVQLLKAAGVDVGYTIPREGALAWLDCWVITRNARDVVLAHAWIDHLLGKQASELLVARQGLANTLMQPGADLASGRLVWLEPVEDAARREKLWARIRSGDRAAKVLAP